MNPIYYTYAIIAILIICAGVVVLAQEFDLRFGGK
tara:strand:+ start:1225 stop:1329 length:105 start_codon:yes stop_codon:yes gene_type:complete